MGTIYLFDEIWVIIFDYLRLRDVFQCTQVSIRWNELASTRLKYDESLLKQWHNTDTFLAQHVSAVKRGNESVSPFTTFIGDLGLLVNCYNCFDKISFAVHSLNNVVFFHTTRYNFLSDYYVISHYHKVDKILIIHFKYKRSINVHFDYQFNFGELATLTLICPCKINYVSETSELNGRCERCAQFTTTPILLLAPSQKYYETQSNLIFANRPDLLRVGYQFRTHLNIYENGEFVRSLHASVNSIKVVDSEHVFAKDEIYNIVTRLTHKVVGFDNDATFHQVGPIWLHESSDHVWKIVRKHGNQWSLSEPLSQKGQYPAFCPRENRLLFFMQ